MKKKLWTLAAGLALSAALAAPAMAQTTGIALNDMTLLIQDGQVTIQEPGRPDRTMPLEAAGESGLLVHLDDMTLLIQDGQVTIQEPGRPDRTMSLEAAEESGLLVHPDGESLYVACEADDCAASAVTIDAPDGTVSYRVEDRRADGEPASATSDSDGFAAAPATAIDALNDDTIEISGLGDRSVSAWREADGTVSYRVEDRRADSEPASATAIDALNDDTVEISGLGDRSVSVRRGEGGAAFHADGESISIVTGEDGSLIFHGGATGISIEAEAFDSLDGAEEANYDAYLPFGLRYDRDEDALYYQGQRVRVFEDSYELDDGAWATRQHVDPDGTIDVEAQRDLSKPEYNEDGSMAAPGALAGLRALSDAEFAARDLDALIAPSVEVTDFAVAAEPSAPSSEPSEQVETIAGEPLTPEEEAAFYAPFAPYGLEYDANTGHLIYQGRRVREFLDVRQTNGEALSSGRFHGTMTHTYDADGEVDVKIIRDYDHPDGNGDGALMGIQIG